MKRTVKIGLGARLVLAMGAILLLSAVLMRHVFGTVFFRDAYESDLKAQTHSVAQRLEEYFAQDGFLEAFLRKDTRACAQLQFLGDYERMGYAEIWVVAGDTVMISYNEQRQSLEFDEIPSRYGAMLDQIFSGRNVGNREYADVWNRNMVGVGAPVLNANGMVVAAVIAQVSNEHVANTMHSANTAVSWSVTVSILIAAVAVIFLSQYLSRPLMRMKTAAETWMTEEYTARTGVRRGDEIGDLAASMDVMAERLEQVQRAREESERARYQFFADVSHELKTPVTVLRAQMEMLLDGMITDPAEQRQSLENAIDETQQMQRLVEDLLSLAKLQSPEFTLDMHPLCLCSVLSDLQRTMQPLAEKLGVLLVFDRQCANEQACTVNGDYTRIRQMIRILVDNAMKSSPRGGTITIRIDREEEHPVISVEDNGAGMSPEELAHVFERFYSHYNSGATGSGLGLPLALQIAKRHGAELSMTSRLGEGTTATVRF